MGITSEIPLPELILGAAANDATVRLQAVDRTVAAGASDRDCLLRANPEEVCFHWNRIGACLVRQGREILVDVHPCIEAQFLSSLVLTVPLAMLLHQRGMLVLHASAIAANGGAIAFLGRSGKGKSTITAALNRLGYPVVTDDVLAISLDPSGAAIVSPSFPQMRLWKESLIPLGKVPDTQLAAYASSNKHTCPVPEADFQRDALPLKRLYVLEDGMDLTSELLRPRDSFLEIVRQSYPGQAVLQATRTVERKFEHCARLVGSVPVYRLHRPRSLALLPEVATFVQEDLRMSEVAYL
ncbi:MAG: hypothetical protein HC925_07380 [Coleofasciculaceae cyanobacterium SM2_3_26]|nr:hypothetical protein [Coleofasciculaceae cyanobacterium SM2_3_26]